ncbi:hypothetical protein TNCV_3834641 [Trichonephila clavipes]|nr:hypothetical protein TNCV_3834641 [Trichonephila clavipes]
MRIKCKRKTKISISSSSERKATNNKKGGEWRPYREKKRGEYLISLATAGGAREKIPPKAGVNQHPVPPLDSGRWGGVNKNAPSRSAGMTWAEMGRPPHRPRTPRLKPHTTPPNQISTETRRGEKKLQQTKRIHEVQCPNILYMSTKKSIYNQHLPPKHNIAPTIKLSSQPEQQINKKKLTNPNIPEKKKKKTKFQAQNTMNT